MSAVPKQNILPFPEPEDGEFPYQPISEMMCPPTWGKYNHSEEELKVMWGRIWRCFKSKELCKRFMYYNRVHSLEVWAEAFETVRAKKEGGFDHVIRYAKRIGDRYAVEGTPSQVAAREAEEIEKAAKARNPKYVVVDPESPDVKAFEKRAREAPQSNAEANPLVLKYEQMIRGKK